ncbi:putative translation-associated protein [Staphylococcus phage Twort]|uniref:ORF134 n=2 Tax=Staphylococcus phage Twort (strain DSM 17442 / HER 48) TaxID=2908167 RepID=Q4Z8Z1_BPTWO|nr:ORF134 [Staphylococcus phage Twort]AAX92422.1 ORF134 [Staphylococcus phage Twort]QIW89073.1 putative translation-associated protein [Staphylococcus phage Twort]
MNKFKKWFNKKVLGKNNSVYKVTYKYTSTTGKEETFYIRVIELNKVRAKHKADEHVFSKIAYKDNLKFVNIREE